MVKENMDTAAMTAKNPLSHSALARKDMRRGRQIAFCTVEHGVIVTGTVMSSPFDDDPKDPDRETGRSVLVRSDESGETQTYTLYELGVVPDDNGDWYLGQFLLDANRVKRLPAYGGDSDAYCPPDRGLFD